MRHVGVGARGVDHLRGFRHLACLGGHCDPFLLRGGQGRPRLAGLVGGRSGAVIADAADDQQHPGVAVCRRGAGQLLQQEQATRHGCDGVVFQQDAAILVAGQRGPGQGSEIAVGADVDSIDAVAEGLGDGFPYALPQPAGGVAG